MLVLSAYVVDEEIYENNIIKVYRGRQIQDGRSVVIKALKEDTPNPAGISRLLYEYELCKSLDIEGITKPVRLEHEGITFALVMEDTWGISLRQYIQNYQVSIDSFFDISIQLAEILGDIHQQGVVHRDLKLENIFIQPNTARVKIIDLSAAVRFQHEQGIIAADDVPVGAMQHLPPEQRGRTARLADYRGDFYLLGAIYYEMLTGRLPWQDIGYTELPDDHTMIEQALQAGVKPIAKPVLALISKLLAKMPDERYQSAYGLLQDLQECREQWHRTGKIEQFLPGQRDISIKFQLPRQPYGRETETEALRAAFEKACMGQPGIIFVSGYAGIGKTMLVQETIRPIAAGKGFFLTGKFDQLRHNKPYAPFAAAFGELVKQLLTENQEVLKRWKKKILLALGRNGALINELIPELEWLIGAQPPVEILPPLEAQNRFFMVFRNFVRVFVRMKQPLVLFMDDLQWADSASLQLMEYLSRDNDLSCYLLICAYRKDEIENTPQLMPLLENISKGEIHAQRIELSSFSYPQVENFLSSALHCSSESCAALAEALFRKSGGNPFSLCQMLEFIHKQGFLTLDNRQGRWVWEFSSINDMQLENDVLGIIFDKLDKLPAQTKELLKIASCLGNSFDLETLCLAGGVTRAELDRWFLPAVWDGFVIAAADSGEVKETANQTGAAEHYEFLHDWIQQAVYSTIPEEEKKIRHLKIGRLLLQSIGQGNPDKKILTIMDHFNRGLDLLEDQEERQMLAAHNFTAGCKAKAATAYDAALQYLIAGMELLPQDAWSSCRRLSYGLYMERAQCEYMSGSVEASEQLFDIVLKHAENDFELADISSLKMILYAGTGKYKEAVQTGIKSLARFGIKLKPYPGKHYFARELMLYKWRMWGMSTEDLSSLQEIKDPAQRKVAELLVRLACVSSTSHTDLYGLVCLMAGNHAVKYGNSDMAAMGYIGYGLVEGSVLGNYAAGYKLGEVSVTLADKYDKSFVKCIVYFTFGATISHWTQHGRLGLDYMGKAARYAVEAGDALILGYALGVMLENKFIMGASLQEISEETNKCFHDAKRLKHNNLERTVMIYQRQAALLRGWHGCRPEADPDDFDEAAFLELIKEDKNSLATLYFTWLQRYYLFGDYISALAAAEKMNHLFHGVMGFMLTAEGNFYHSLAITAAYEGLSPKDRNIYLKMLAGNQKQMKKWSHSCADNFMHKYLLVAAEEARLSGSWQEAMTLYDRAIRSAQENGYLQDEALANELAAKFYLKAGHEKIARAYMTDACRGYAAWGAGAKVKHLQQRYAGLFEEMHEKDTSPGSPAFLIDALKFSSSSSNFESHSDPELLRKAMQHISDETDLDKLVRGFLDLALIIADADRCCLILEKDGSLFIEADRSENQQTVTAQTIVALERYSGLSKAVVRYTARTLETVVLSGNAQAGIFASDTYVAQGKVKSIACIPVLLRGIPAGVLYLENSFHEGVFTTERLEMLKLLTSQLISAKNSQAYLEVNPEGINTAAISQGEALTAREADVLQLIVLGMSNREIADRLGLKANTVKSYIKNIYGKLGANRRVQVAAKAKELGF